MQTNNKTLYSIDDSPERYFLITYNIFIALSSILGDSLILIASLRYHAFKLHKFLVIIIQHLAVNDLILTLFRVVPETAAVAADTWVVGSFLGHVQFLVNGLCGGLTMSLTCAFSTAKFLIVKYPFRSLTWSYRSVHMTCATLWLAQAILWLPWQLVNFIYVWDTLFFSYRTYQCSYNYFADTTPAWFKQYISCYFLTGTVGLMLVTLVTSCLLLDAARKSAARDGGYPRWEGVWTVLLCVAVFYITNIPWNVVYATYFIKIAYSPSTIRRTFFLTNLNINANFFLYACTVRSFRAFLSQKLRLIFGLKSRETKAQGSPKNKRSTSSKIKHR